MYLLNNEMIPSAFSQPIHLEIFLSADALQIQLEQQHNSAEDGVFEVCFVYF